MIKGISRAAFCLLFFVAPAHAQSNSTPVMGTIIEENGSTSLVEVGSNFFFYPVGQFSGPELSYNGTPFVAGQFGAWTPIGVAQTASGYEVAWKVTGADQYTVWNTDSSGNYTSQAIGVVSGSSVELESLEPSFQQDLNGDGVIGVASTPVNGACGSANGVAVTTAPTTGLCTAGTATTVTGAGPWAWACNGSNGGSYASCSAPLQVASTPVNGACGSANGVAVTIAPTAGLCTAGIATTVTGAGPWAWTCNGSNGGTNSSCSAPLQSASPVNGVCDSANGVAVSTAPTGNLCTAGTATTVSGTGPWTWACNGSNGGANASCSAPVSGTGILPPDRATTWNPGMTAVGGIPVRSTVCSTLTPLGGGRDDTAQINAAITACPVGQVVQLAAGTFIINSGNIIMINRGITLRGAGPGQTILSKTNGAQPYPAPGTGPYASPLVIVGPSEWGIGDNIGVTGSTNLTADAVKETNSITVASTAGFSAGQFVLLDEASGAGWQPDQVHPGGQIWAAPDYRVVWNKHNPYIQYVDDFAPNDFPTTPNTAGQWFSRLDRPTAEIKQIASVSGFTITFTTPIHISYRISHTAQLSNFWTPFVTNAGVENLTITGGDSGNIWFKWAAMSWAKNVESSVWTGVGIDMITSFGIELREFYAHDAAWAQPGGGGYAIGIDTGTAEVLIENGISVRANKVMVARCAGAGSVVGYNYMDMGYINYNGAWIETGLNASHMVGPHHVLFEGNYGFNADSDDTHGNSIYHTFFRNHLRGVRAPFNNQQGGALIDDANQSGNGPKRAAGLVAYSYWMSFIGNVLGAPGQMGGWVYESTSIGTPGIWLLGWDTNFDPQVPGATLRHGNFDYVTNTVNWDPTITNHTLPNSLYLTQAPPFFGAGTGYTWPWVNPTGTPQLYTLPAKARYDAGTPFTQP